MRWRTPPCPTPATSGGPATSYFAQGYEKPHVWPHFAEVPFAPRAKPLAECRLALVSTSEIDFEDEDYANPTDEGRVGGVYAIPSPTPFERLCSHAWAYDRQATTLDDVNALFPLSRLQQMVPKGRIASTAPARSTRPTCCGVAATMRSTSSYSPRSDLFATRT